MNNAGDEALVQHILELGRQGCQGNAQDFQCWLEYAFRVSAALEDVHRALDSLERSGRFRAHPEVGGDFLCAESLNFSRNISYEVSGDLEFAPIQMVRSRLESFLRCHGAGEEDIIDLAIATTEAMENAVKYSDQTRIQVEYELENADFRIRILNPVKEAQPEQDMEQGKYSSATTLMRGMMVMVKLFDQVDLDISDEQGLVTMSASRKLNIRS